MTKIYIEAESEDSVCNKSDSDDNIIITIVMAMMQVYMSDASSVSSQESDMQIVR